MIITKSHFVHVPFFSLNSCKLITVVAMHMKLSVWTGFGQSYGLHFKITLLLCEYSLSAGIQDTIIMSSIGDVLLHHPYKLLLS